MTSVASVAALYAVVSAEPLWLRRTLCRWAAAAVPVWACCVCVAVVRPLGALRLRLVLRRLGFCSASALFLLAFLCECRKGSSQK